MRYDFRPRGVCSANISFDLDGDIVRDVRFSGGCDGNLQALSRLIEGMTVPQIADKLNGIRCGNKATSCPDQLVLALTQAVSAASGAAERAAAPLRLEKRR